MEMYTSQADNLYQDANKIEYPDYVPPYTSCYKSLLEFEEIITRAREMESAARDIRKKFREIAASGLPIPSSLLLRKAIISVKRDKVMFSTDQLVQVVDVMMENLPYILFCPKSETKNMLFYYSGPLTWTMLHVKYKKNGNHQTRNSSGSISIALCGGKCTSCKTSLPLLTQQLHLFKSAKRRCLPPAARQPRTTEDLCQAFN